MLKENMQKKRQKVDNTLYSDCVETGIKDDSRKYNFGWNKLKFVQDIYLYKIFEICKIYYICAFHIYYTHTHTHTNLHAHTYV